MTCAIVIPAAAIAAPVATIGNPEHALDRAHGATDAGADCAADHAPYRACDPVAFIRSFLGATDDALGVPAWGIASSASTMAAAASPKRTGKPAGSAAVLTLVLFI